MTPSHDTTHKKGPMPNIGGHRLILGVATLLILLCAILPAQAEVSNDQAKVLLEALDTPNFKDKAEAAKAIADSEAEQKVRWLEALLDGRLGHERRGERFYIITNDSGREWPIIDAISYEDAGRGTRRSVKTIGINNALRTQLQGSIASLSLTVSDESTRLAAAQRLIGELDSQGAERIEATLDDEQSSAVRAQLKTALALYHVQQGDKEALEQLRGNLDTRVRNTLTTLVNGDSPIGTDAREILESIENKRAWYGRAQTLFFGLSAGSILVLAAIGLAITFGVMGVINMAHGELIMLGAYTTWMIQQLLPGQLGLALLLAIPCGFMVAAAFGIVIERSVIRFLKGRPLETLLATFGLSLILQQLVRTVFSPLNRRVESPSWLQGAWHINEALSLTLNRLGVLIFCLVVFAALWTVMRYTRLGLEVRAVTQNRAMARAMGIHASRVDMLTFGLGAGVAGLAGVALSQITNVGPNLGQGYVVDSFLVVVFGGVGNLWGTLVAGMSLGVINQVLQPWVGAVLAKIIVLIGVILFIQKRPQGIFAPKGRA